MKRFVIWLVRRYFLKAINKLLKKHQKNVSYITYILDTWIKRIQIILVQLQLISQRVSDGEIDKEEIEKSIDEIRYIIQTF